jgi:hypothetical protein
MQDECSKNTGRTFDVGGMYALSRRSRLTNGGAILSAEGSHAKTSPTPASELESAEHAAVCGLSSLESFACFVRDSSLWRTHQRCLLEGWVWFSGTWPRSGTMRSGRCYRHRSLVRITFGRDSSYWPTLLASEPKRMRLKPESLRAAYLKKDGKLCRRLTEELVVLEGIYPTPIFAEWLMGMPQNWTVCELADSETPSSPKSPSGSDIKS